MSLSRRRSATGALLCAVLLASGCTTPPTLITLADLTQRYDRYAPQREALVAEGKDATQVEAKLSALAGDARTAAQTQSDAKAAVAMWRIAALSAWQGGTAGHAQLLSIVTAGEAACDQLSPPDFAQPGDCLQIRLAPVRAAHDEAKANVAALEATPKPLPRSDHDEIVRLFNRLESDYVKASDLGQRFQTSSIDSAQLDSLNRVRESLFCLARADLNLLTDVETGDGDPQGLDAITPFAARRDAMRAGLPPDLRAAPCR